MTDKRQMACELYCAKGIINREKGYSWSQAMRDAGFKEGYIVKNAHWLKDLPEIKAKIEDEKAKFRQKIGLEAEDVINELTTIGFSNIDDFLQVDDEGNVYLRGFKGIDRAKLAAIESVKVNTTRNKDDSREYTTTQFKLHSKLNALEQLCKHLGLYERDNRQGSSGLTLNFTTVRPKPVASQDVTQALPEAAQDGPGQPNAEQTGQEQENGLNEQDEGGGGGDEPDAGR